MKNTRLLILGALLLLGQRSIFAQGEPATEASLHSEEITAATPVVQDQQKSKAPTSDYGKYDVPPELLKEVRADYPDEAMKKNLEGAVWVQLRVSEEGKVTETKVLKTEAEVFNEAAVKAGSQWLFKPASLNGKPVASWVTVPFNFKLMSAKGPTFKTRVVRGSDAPELQRDSLEKGPEPIKTVQPSYPDAAKKDKIQGTIWIKVRVDEAGEVADATVEKSDSNLFESTAIDAVKQWRFKPALSKGKPVSVWVTIPFRFALADKEKAEPRPAVTMKTRPVFPKNQIPPVENLKVDKDPEAIEQVNPKYTAKALQDKIEGTVWVKMWVDESGNVVEAMIAKSDNDALNEAAIEAGKQWKFKPALLKGKPVAVWITVPFRFKIAGK